MDSRKGFDEDRVLVGPIRLTNSTEIKNYKKNDDLRGSNFNRGILGRPILFILFKFILLIYWSILWSWRLVDFYILSPAEKWEEDKNYTRTREYPDYLTNWGDTLIMLYLLYSTLLAVRIFYLEARKVSGDIGKATIGYSEHGIKWYYFPAQILFEIAANLALLITILYFGLIGGGDLTDILNIHPHIINCKLCWNNQNLNFSIKLWLFFWSWPSIEFRFVSFILCSRCVLH